MEQLVARLDVAMFNAILRESAEEMPTDPVSDPISDSKVLPIPAGKSSFGSGAQLKNAVSIFIKNLIWATLISSFISRFHYFITFSFLFCKTVLIYFSDNLQNLYPSWRFCGPLEMKCFSTWYLTNYFSLVRIWCQRIDRGAFIK